MAETKLLRFWEKHDLGRDNLAAVSLHSHTNCSKESLYFLPKLAERWPILKRALDTQCKKSAIPVDFVRAFWRPPLTPKLALEIEKHQIEEVLGLASLVSLTDHDSIEAPAMLRATPGAERVPLSLEWSVPFGAAKFHLGVHNLPPGRAQEIVADLAAYTRSPSDQYLSELMAMLDQFPEVLIIFNHPLWNLCSLGGQQSGEVLNRFLHKNAKFLHAFELNAMRSSKENNGVIELAERWERPLISGGDRHGCDPNGALNLTRTECFSEFVHEIRRELRSHVLLMPQYAEPMTIRTIRTLLDVIRNYPEFPAGSRRWDERVFHLDRSGLTDRPISTLWKEPPAFVEQIFSVIRLLENSTMERMFRSVTRRDTRLDLPSKISPEISS